MIVVIRIAGQTQLDNDVIETLYRMRLRKKFVATLMEDNPENRKLLLKMRNYVAFGEIPSALLVKLLEARGVAVNKKSFDANKMAKLIESKGLVDSGIKPFFRLHPPRGGIESKKHYGVNKGVLGDNKEGIIKLLERML